MNRVCACTGSHPARGATHSPATFRHWVEHEYCPAECRGVVEILDPPGVPVVMRSASGAPNGPIGRTIAPLRRSAS